MSSKNKKNKLVNSYQVPSGLKEKLNTGVKRLSFYTSSARQKLKEELNEEVDNMSKEKECRDCWHNYHCPMPQEGYDYNPDTCPYNPDNKDKDHE